MRDCAEDRPATRPTFALTKASDLASRSPPTALDLARINEEASQTMIKSGADTTRILSY